MPDNNNSQHLEYIPPDSAIESLARCLLPAIQEYFESEQGKHEFEEWKRKKEDEKQKHND